MMSSSHRIHRFDETSSTFAGTAPIFTENLDTLMRLIDEIKTGTAYVSEPTFGGEVQLPFGGI